MLKNYLKVAFRNLWKNKGFSFINIMGLAVGMASIFSKLTHGRWLDVWYHFAMMFEALFILTTLDAGTRVGRYFVQDALGQVWPALGRTGSMPAALFASALVVLSWGFFVVRGVASGWVPVRAAAGGVAAAQAASLYLFAYYLGSSVFGGLAGRVWSTGAWPAVVAMVLALLAVCGGLTFWLRRIPALASVK